jgi:putative two-component system response regulator
MSDPTLENFNILVIDDEETNVKLLDQMLATEGYRNVRSTSSSEEGLQCILSGWPDLVLLDLHMPQPDGYEILKQVRGGLGSSSGCPILVFTADAMVQTRREALKWGASDFLTKPGDMIEIILRVKNFLELRKLQKDLVAANMNLEQKVLERTQDLWEANLEVVFRLARAAEYRDDQTGEHVHRVADLAHRIAIQMGVPHYQAEMILLAGPLHDVGKIALADSILLKEGPLTEEEREIMKHHTTIGAGILANGKSDLLKTAEIIAVSHHERWDGKGYPFGLSGDSIPLVGRILAVADVYDALINKRPYKPAWPPEQAVEELRKNAGTQFDPAVVEAALVVLQETAEDAARKNPYPPGRHDF